MKNTVANEELLPLVDKNDEVIGTINRSAAHKNPHYIHRIVAILIYTSKGEMLIHKRSSTKDVLPGCWDLSAAGHVSSGEDYIEAAVHELYEEVGIKASENDLKTLGKFLIKTSWETEFCQIYRYNLKKKDTININKEEIEEAKFVSTDELKRLLRSKKLKWNPKTRDLFKNLSL